jgi:hypothetical protein
MSRSGLNEPNRECKEIDGTEGLTEIQREECYGPTEPTVQGVYGGLNGTCRLTARTTAASDEPLKGRTEKRMAGPSRGGTEKPMAIPPVCCTENRQV